MDKSYLLKNLKGQNQCNFSIVQQLPVLLEFLAFGGHLDGSPLPYPSTLRIQTRRISICKSRKWCNLSLKTVQDVFAIWVCVHRLKLNLLQYQGKKSEFGKNKFDILRCFLNGFYKVWELYETIRKLDSDRENGNAAGPSCKSFHQDIFKLDFQFLTFLSYSEWPMQTIMELTRPLYKRKWLMLNGSLKQSAEKMRKRGWGLGINILAHAA